MGFNLRIILYGYNFEKKSGFKRSVLLHREIYDTKEELNEQLTNIKSWMAYSVIQLSSH